MKCFEQCGGLDTALNNICLPLKGFISICSHMQNNSSMSTNFGGDS